MIKRAMALTSLAVPATAGDFSLQPPIGCNLETDCYIQQYVDHDPTDRSFDFTCGSLSFNAHKGTDFAIPDLARMEKGVAVMASASGVVKSVRDGMPDTGYTTETKDQIDGRECGNGIVLQHEDGWETQYCHLKRGSIAVGPGQDVALGQPMAQVGMSGLAQFPHVHLSVRHNGSVVDPFDPTGVISCTAPDQNQLWATVLPYRPGGIIAVGVSDDAPEYEAVKAGTATQEPLERTADALVVFGYFFGTREDDIIDLSLLGPAGEIVDQQIRLKKSQALAFRAAGRKRRAAEWPSGTYDAEISLIRAGQVIEARKTQLTLP